MRSNSQFENYAILHNDFSEVYHSINHHVLELYSLPKKFIEETGPALDRFIREYSVPGSPRSHDLSTKAILEFIGQVDDFTSETSQLFEAHKKHVDNCSAYMKQVDKMEGQENLNLVDQDGYNQLTQEVMKLNFELYRIKTKADEMVLRLDQLEMRWARIRIRVNQ